MNKTKLIWGGIVIIAIIFAGFLWYQSGRKNKTLQEGTQGNMSDLEESGIVNDIADIPGIEEEGGAFEDQDFNSLCENGEWVKLSDQTGDVTTISGKMRKVYPDDEAASQFKAYMFFLEGAAKMGLTSEKLATLDYFEDREVELKGVKNAEKNDMAVSEVRCAGKETNKDLIGERKKLMDYLEANIASLAPQKAKYQKWTVDIVDFVDENNVYVEYYDAVEDDENSNIEEDTARRILVATSPKTGGYDARVLAYWEMGEDDYALKSGTDKFEDVEEVTTYQYDPETKTWERID